MLQQNQQHQLKKQAERQLLHHQESEDWTLLLGAVCPFLIIKSDAFVLSSAFKSVLYSWNIDLLVHVIMHAFSECLVK